MKNIDNLSITGKWKVKKNWWKLSNLRIPSLKNNFTGAATLISVVYLLSIEWSQIVQFDLLKSLSRVQAIFFVSGMLEVLTCIATIMTCNRQKAVHSSLPVRLQSLAALLSDYRLNRMQNTYSSHSISFITIYRLIPLGCSFFITLSEIFIYNDAFDFKEKDTRGIIDFSKFWWVTRTALIYNRFYNYTFLITVAKVGRTFEILNDEFVTIVQDGRSGLKVRFITLKFAYDVSVELCETIAAEFGVRNLMMLITDTVVFVWTLYSVAAMSMISMLEGHRFHFNVFINEVHLWMWGILFAMELIIITAECTSTTKWANKLAGKVYTHKSGNACTTIKDQLKYFKLQQLHHSLNMTVLGLFPLNFSLLGSMTGTITRYLVIMVQFSLMVTPSTEDSSTTHE